MTPPVSVRFAPSPTGHLHVGNARTAILNWLFARAHGGQFLLRLDDTDRERSKAVFEHAITEDLAWLGLDWDRFERQSARQARYDAAVDALRESGRLYPCFETTEELALKRRIQLGRGKPPVYDRAALTLDEGERAKLLADGRTPHWRFKLDDRPIAWDDSVRGPVRFEAGHLSDPVLVRADGRPLYTLTSVVDDGELGISHVLRGEDHVANTAVQIELFEALGHTVPTFAHVPLMIDSEGKQLSKRIGSLTLAQLRSEGVEPEALVAYLARLGTATAADGADDRARLIGDFGLAAYGRAAPRFDEAELAQVNAKVVHAMSFEAAAPRLRALGLERVSTDFWQAVRENCDRLEDADVWWTVCYGEIEPAADPEDRALLHQAAEYLPPPPWDEAGAPDLYDRWIGAVKEATGRKGKALFGPLRLALTGRPRGPELRALLPLIGYERAYARLRG